MLARAGTVVEGFWLRAERQTAGRGRQGRAWQSPAGNFSASTLVKLRSGDPPAATLGFVVAVALVELVARLLPSPTGDMAARVPATWARVHGDGAVLKWPNDVLIDGAKLSGILLERAEDVVVIGIGVNLAEAPDVATRPTTSLATLGVQVGPDAFGEMLADGFARWFGRWRAEGFAPVRARWLERAYPNGTVMSVNLPSGEQLLGQVDGLDADGALILRLADGERRTIHAGDVFLV